MARHIIHVDMDAFFAAVEVLDRPALRGQCVIVGGPAEGRGVVSAASYEARRFGVHSAMPMAQALRRCPHAVVLPGRMERYSELSRQIQGILERFSPEIEPISIDEAFLDVTACRQLLGLPETVARQIKTTIRDETGLTASVGVAGNKFLAKLASDLDKPDGLVVIQPQDVQAVLDPLPVKRIWGVGAATAGRLVECGIETIGQLRRADAELLRRLLGNQAELLRDLARGIDERPVQTETAARSIGSERTFARDIGDAAILRQVLLDQVEHVAWRLRRSGQVAGTVAIKCRYGDFRTVTRQQQLPEPTDLTQPLWDATASLFEHWWQRSGGPLRLLGVTLAGLQRRPRGPVSLFPDPDAARQARLDQAVDAVRQRFGRDKVGRAGAAPGHPHPRNHRPGAAGNRS